MVLQDRAVAHGLAREAQSVKRARAIVSGLLEGGEWASRLDTALLLVSELVGNAVRYGEEPITLYVEHEKTELVVAVSDSAPGLPEMLPPAPAETANETSSVIDISDHEPTGGRGLRLIASLADSWGVEKRARDKKVWFALRRPAET